MYRGKEICHGCRKMGSENPRYSKNQLCNSCEGLMKLGKAFNHEESIKYTQVRDWYHGFNSIDFNDNLLDSLANDFFKALHSRYAETSNRVDSKRSQYLGSEFYNIPTVLVQPLFDFLDGLNTKIKEIKNLKESTEMEARRAVANEKDRIFNEGVDAGRDLLFQLNAGKITTEDFNEKLNYNES